MTNFHIVIHYFVLSYHQAGYHTGRLQVLSFLRHHLLTSVVCHSFNFGIIFQNFFHHIHTEPSMYYRHIQNKSVAYFFNFSQLFQKKMNCKSYFMKLFNADAKIFLKKLKKNFCPQKVEKTTSKSCLLMAVGSFFSLQPRLPKTAQKFISVL